jgi:hypothetical protein
VNSPYWFEVAVVCGLVSIGGIVFAPFAEGVPIWQRLLKLGVGVGLGILISATAGRVWFFIMVGAILSAVAVIHGWWLPKQGINGLTAEPRDRYHAMRGWKRNAGRAPVSHRVD